jgi:hypothetical protein
MSLSLCLFTPRKGNPMIRTRSGLHAILGVAGISVVLMVLVLGGAPALAARGHEYGYAFGENVNKTAIVEGRPAAERNVCPAPGHPADVCQNGESGTGPGRLSEPAGLAMNEATGVLYIADRGNKRIDRFDAKTGVVLGSFDGGTTFESEPGVIQPTTEAGHGGSPEEEPSGKFVEPPEALAVDNACDRHTPQLTGAACEAFDPSNGDVYVVERGGPGDRAVDKFSPTGAYIGQITEKTVGSSAPYFPFAGVAINNLGEVWITDEQPDPPALGTGQFIERLTNAVANKPSYSKNIPASFFDFAHEVIPALAVDSEEDLYIPTGSNGSVASPHIEKYSSTGQKLIAEFAGANGPPGTPSGLVVESSTGDVYVDSGTSWTRVSSAGKQLESLSVPGGGGTGLAVSPVVNGGDMVYVADSSADLVYVYLPEGPGPPTIQAGRESVEGVTASSARFSAEVNPRSEEDEEATSYSFEYGPCGSPATCSSSPFVDSVPMPEGRLAANYEPDVVGAQLQGLLAHTTYHVRLVAHNSHPGVVEGEELTFTTQATGAFSLPDGRAWEMVSPPDKYGALIQAEFYVSQASVGGDAITYYADAPIEAQPVGNTDSVVQALAARGPGGWRSLNISAPHETEPGALTPPEYPFFSSDLSVGLLEPAGAFVASLSAEASEQTPFLRTDFSAGEPDHFCTSSCYTPLVTGAAGVENVPPGTVFGSKWETGQECVAFTCGPRFAGANHDLSNAILEYPWAPLVEGAPLGSLYGWASGRLSVVSVLPDESLAAGGTLGTTGGWRIVRNAVSLDGSRVVWSDGSHLYLRDSAKEKTVQLDEVQGGSGAGATGEPAFQTASSDDSRVFFIDSQRLTKEASGPADLYECEIFEEAGELECKLTDLTGGTGESAGVVGIIPGASEDGSYVYLVANGVLTGGQATERGEAAVAGQPNLYVRHAGVTSLIGVLSREDSGDWEPEVKRLTARVSPDGRWFSFMSDRPLTGYDNRDAQSGERDEEVFLYHAGESGEGRLACASCNPSGGRPQGAGPHAGQAKYPGPGEAEFSHRWVAGMLPGWTSSLYQSRYLSNSGRLFFDGFDALVPQDTNGAEDAYQFEPSGVGSCTEASATFVVASDGCVGLVSSGTSTKNSGFLDASESGRDVFFLTSAQLSPLDTDTALDIYDAHECALGEDCSPPVFPPEPACEGDACQSPVAAPEDPTPASLTYQGPGNPPAPLLSAKAKPQAKTLKCKKGSVVRHGKCVKTKAKAKKRAKKAKRSNRRGK